MAFAITQTCCNDASCVSVCPVNCIHPTPGEPDFGTTEMLYIDPRTCIDCGACADACPVDAVLPLDQLTGPDEVYADINRQYYDRREVAQTWDEPRFPRPLPVDEAPKRVAIVGTGPAASYTAELLLRSTNAEVTLIDRLPVPGGLVRYGVAPDHPSTKRIADGFGWLYQHPRLTVHMNVEIGTDITHEELAAHHHAVFYGVGAGADRNLGIPGEDLPGSLSATRFVAWYNAHPDVPAAGVDLSSERAVVVGNGNVALDVARILLGDHDLLARTDIADHALDALRGSKVREVVLLARRGPEHAAFTSPEFLALQHLPGVRVVVDDHPRVREALGDPEPGSKAELLSGLPVEQVDWSAPPPEDKRIVLRFWGSPTEFCGDEQVRSVRVQDNAESTSDEIPAGLVVRSIGYRNRPVPGLPFDEQAATVPNDTGRVVDENGEPVAGAYVVGWIKRGPSGGIGTNRTCAEETVETFLDDAAARELPEPAGTAKEFGKLVRKRKPDAVGRKEVLAIDRAERERGGGQRPRVKFATVPDLLSAAKRNPLARLGKRS
jgi:ferredoxin--NADP+ reductase